MSTISKSSMLGMFGNILTFCVLVINALTSCLYNVYSNKKTAKEVWESLDRNYKTEDVGTKKFFMGHFLDYKW